MKYPMVLALVVFSVATINAQKTKPETIVRAQLEAYNLRDLDKFSALFAEDILIFEYGNPSPFVDGKRSLLAAYAAVFESSPNLYAESINRILQGNKVIDHQIAEGINGGDKVQVVVVYEIDNALIRRVTFIY